MPDAEKRIDIFAGTDPDKIAEDIKQYVDDTFCTYPEEFEDEYPDDEHVKYNVIIKIEEVR